MSSKSKSAYKSAQNFYRELLRQVDSIRVTDREGNKSDFYHGIELAVNLVKSLAASEGKLMFIGNGASASIASHISTDFFKNGGIKAVAFNDSSLLTCLSNDFGYEHVFEKPVEMFARAGDILFAISSSGSSENILRGVRAATSKSCKVITLSGFKSDNPLSAMGDINYYVQAQEYGPVEIIHHSICHCILDTLMDTG